MTHKEWRRLGVVLLTNAGGLGAGAIVVGCLRHDIWYVLLSIPLLYVAVRVAITLYKDFKR